MAAERSDSKDDDTQKTALVAGATGVVGRNLLRQLVSDPDWDVIAASQRAPDRYRHIAADPLDPAAANRCWSNAKLRR